MKPAFDPTGFADRLRRAIERRGTIAAAARACDMPKPTLEGYLYRVNLPTARALAQLALGLQVSVDWLLFGEPMP